MSQHWVDVAIHGDKSMKSTHIGHLILYFSKKGAASVTFSFNVCMDSQKPQNLTCDWKS